jgi:phospholipase C
MFGTGTRVGSWAMRLLLAGVAAAAVFGPLAADASASQSGKGTGGGPDHIFYIMMENHAYNQIIGNTQDAPFINRLASRNHLATNFHGVTHPSLPNYLAAISGDFQGIWDDCAAGPTITCAPEEFVPDSGDGTAPPPGQSYLTPDQITYATNAPHWFAGKNIVDQLEAHGISWKAYMENLPSPGSTVVDAPVINGTHVKLYAQKHNPFMYFSDVNTPARLSKIVPYEPYQGAGGFLNNLQNGTVPNFSFIAPNQCHDMHGISPSAADLINLPSCGFPDSGLDHGAIALGDRWLRQTVTAIENSAVWQDSNSEIIIAWDENDYSTDLSGGPFSPTGVNGVVLGGGPAPLIVVSNQDQGQLVNNTLLDHYNTLYAIQQMWHLGCLANTCKITNGNQFMNLFTDDSNSQ